MPRNATDMFITLEGIEGSGKTTALPHLVDLMERRGHPCQVTREPGGTPFGQRLRSILLDPESGAIDPAAELLLYCADRVQHVRTVIQPALEAGRTVVCDRYMDATLAYQGGARGLGLDLIRAVHRLAVPPLVPDVTFLFDLEPRIGLARAWAAVEDGQRHQRESRFEAEALAFLGALGLPVNPAREATTADQAAAAAELGASFFLHLAREIVKDILAIVVEDW